MKRKLEKRFKQLDVRLLQLLEDLKGYNDEQLNRPPRPGKWSPVQVMQHLMLSEHYGHAYLKKKLSFNPTLRKAGLMAGLRASAVHAYLKLPFSFKAPKVVSTEQLESNVPFWELAKRWKDQRSDLKTYLLSLPDDTLRREIYKHPMGGRLSAAGMLGFFAQHFDRHEKQIKKALRKVPKQH